MRYGRMLIPAFLFLVAAGVIAERRAAAAEGNRSALDRMREDFVQEPMPPGFQVILSEVEGPVFADADGRTLYTWPLQSQRNAKAGEIQGKPACYDERYRLTAGTTSPYPAGRVLPNADTRPTCVQHWPPVRAAAGAVAVGDWTILDRTDGTKQWAYRQWPLYTSHLDHQPGDTNGGSNRMIRNDGGSGGAYRLPARPTPAIPPQFELADMARGLMLINSSTKYSIYTFSGDAPGKSTCYGKCLEEWAPVLAPDSAVEQGPWSVISRQDDAKRNVGGTRQWAYRGKPLYTRLTDISARSYTGSDVRGWDNVFLHRTPAPPPGFHLVDTRGGQVIADPDGKTIYSYACVEDSADTLFCDSPDSPQVYRWAMCGGGDPERCLRTFPYVIARDGAERGSQVWSIISINPKTGRIAEAGSADALRVWAYRGRPIYTFAGDQKPGDIGGDSWGQDHGQRNGFTAFWIRTDFNGLDGGY